MRATRLVGAGLVLAGVLVQAGCTKGDGASPDAVASEKATGAKAESSVVFSPVKVLTRSAILPEGTPLVVRTTSTLSTRTHQAGQTFTAHLEQPWVLDGREIVAKGAEVEGTVVGSDPGGRVDGRATLSVQVTSLRTAAGQVLEISTGSITREARGTKRNDAVKIGIGSGIGAAIGAIAGGGKGAAIGAGAGAGAGTGVVLGTRGDPAVIPSESVLTFALRTPVTVDQ